MPKLNPQAIANIVIEETLEETFGEIYQRNADRMLAERERKLAALREKYRYAG